MKLWAFLSKYPNRAKVIVGIAVGLWLLISTAPLLGLQVCLIVSIVAYLSGRVVLARVLARPRVETAALSRYLRPIAIGTSAGALVLVIGALQVMSGTFANLIHSAAGSSTVASASTQIARVDTPSAGVQAAAALEPLTVHLSPSLSIDLSLLVGLAILLFFAWMHFIGAAGKLPEKLKNSTRSPHRPAILGLLALALVAFSDSHAPPTAPSTPIASKAAQERTNTEKRAALEALLSEKLAALQQLEATLHVATSTSAADTKTIDDMSLWRNTSRPNPADIETLRADIDKIEKELGGKAS